MILEVKNLKKYFPIRSGIFQKKTKVFKAVDGVSFSIKDQETVAIVGESGSGKSTLARCSIRLLEPTEASIRFMGRDLLQFSKKELLDFRKQVQIVFQDPFSSLNPRKKILDAIGEPLKYHYIVKNEQEKKERVIEILHQVGLSEDALMRYPHQFSGGQQQRICIGRAIAFSPRLLVCDEAVSALDVSVQAQILNLLKDLKNRLNLSYLFISHDLSVVKYFCDRIIVMYGGKVVEEGSTEEIFSNPQHEYTQTLLQAAPITHPKKRCL